MTEASPVIDAWAKVRSAFTSLLNYLNLLGSVLLAYALANPSAAAALVQVLPEQYRPYAPLIAGLWFGVVQWAKMSAIKKAMQA
jgi:hypothetical protein